MTNKQIFDNVIFDLPISRGNENLHSYLSGVYDQYRLCIRKFKKDLRLKLKPQLPLIESQIELIKKAIEKYLCGFPAEAFTLIESALKQLDSNNFLPIENTSKGALGSNFYRVRVSEAKSLKRKDLFHVPFEMREKVATQRYSIPGLPCLYLADSLFVCWEEMGRPSINSLNASRFDLAKGDLKLLYFNISSKEIRSRCFTKSNDDGKLIPHLVTYLCYWPLLAACSMLVSKPSDIFKPEYIVPQLVLQWIVSSKKIDGVYYKSNRVKAATYNMGTFSNVIIPIKKVSDLGYCPVLSKVVKLTSPLSFELIDISGYSIRQNSGDLIIEDLRRAMYVELIDGEKTDYSKTKFGIMESKLIMMPVDFI